MSSEIADNLNANAIDHERHQRARIFTSDVMEALSKVHPSVPFIFWLPVLAVVGSVALYTGMTSPRAFAVFLLLGFVVWQFLEYFIHKGFFHWEGVGPISRRIHEIIHGYHHKYPDDASRLVMPLTVSIPLGALIAALLWLPQRPDVSVPVWIGVVLGYLWYDFMHWSSHHRKPRTAWGRRLRGHHMSHHFADPLTNYGISHRYIDLLLGTQRRRDVRRDGDEGRPRTPDADSRFGGDSRMAQ